MKPIISVIVPVYRVEPYLRKCIDSIRAQTFRDLEIILVDDGSGDRCGQICDEYAQKDSRIRVIHKENGGLSSARNTGISVARGEYLGFVDSDDWIDPDMFAFLYRNCVKEAAGISVCGIYEHTGRNIRIHSSPDAYCTRSAHEAVCSVLQPDHVRMFVWNKLFRRDLFSQLRFPEGRIYEDAFVIVRLMEAAERVAVDLSPKYHYLQRAGSITHSDYRPAMLDLADAHQSNYRYVLEKYPDLAPAAKSLCLRAYFRILDAMLMSSGPVDAEKKNACIQYLRSSKKEILRDPFFTGSRKLALKALCIHVSIYRLLLRLKKSRAAHRGP